MQKTTPLDLLTTAYATLQDCTVPMREASKVGAALNLLAECIVAMKNPPKEESK